MKVNLFIYGLLIVVLFFGMIGGAKAAGMWSVSGKLTASGEKVAPTGTNVEEIKGWMTLDAVSTAYNLPADTPGTAPINTLESDTFSPINLRAWLKARLGQ
jgi:hypothetical protein